MPESSDAPLCSTCGHFKVWDVWGECTLDINRKKVVGGSVGCIFHTRIEGGAQDA